ncbi:hypothetical protein [Streptomyces griseus]|uniref:hypothetical protein n=1 Tax=Streptomyces griseus TaxID=1911 RepID=UPI0004C61BFF|nr:hypothetical protein [Streptomyces griseus]
MPSVPLHAGLRFHERGRSGGGSGHRPRTPAEVKARTALARRTATPSPKRPPGRWPEACGTASRAPK